MHNRRANRIVAAIGIIVEIDGKPFPCMTGNVSNTGLFAMLKHPAPAGTHVTVIIIDDNQKLRAPATIASNTGSGLGILFGGLNPEFDQAWRRIIRRLLRRATVDIRAGGMPKLAWAHPPDGSFWDVLKKRPHYDTLVDLSLDGAAFVRKAPPEIGTQLLVFLSETEDGERKEYHCQAEVVRHTENGFAVRFDNPGIDFRRALTRARQRVALT